MRIGIITGEYPPMQGGIGAYTAILANELARQGNQIAILTSPPAENRGDSSAQDVQVSTAIRDWSIGSIPAIRQWIEATQPDVVNLQYQTAAYKMSPVIHFLPDLLRPTPFVTTFHDLRHPYLFPKAGRLRDWIVMRLARQSSGAIVTNHEDAERLDALDCIQLIPIGSNILAHPPSDLAKYRVEAGVAQGDALIVYFGLVNRSKGLDILLKATRQMLDRGKQIKLALVGAVAGDSDPTNAVYMNEIDQVIRSLRLEQVIHRTAYLQDDAVAGYLAAADVVALPFADGASYRRGSLMAAIRQGCAVVTTQPRVDIPDFVDGVNMRLVPPDDVDALASTLTQLLDDTHLRDTLKQNITLLAHTFDWSRIAQATTTFFEHIVRTPA